MHVVTMIGPSDASCLTAEEVEKLVEFSFHMHDHDARVPAQPIFWVRFRVGDLRRFWN